MIDKRTKSQKKPLLLMILDGWGYNPDTAGNAVAAARTPNLDRLAETYPTALGITSGTDVGLPDGQMGNSEVGHLNMGAGRIVYQDLTLINKEIEDGIFYQNPILLKAVHEAEENGKALHVMGLVSYGGVHSHINHLKALLTLAKKEGLDRVYVHAFLDGRDVPPKSAMKDLSELQEFMENEKIGQIATVTGRYYAMDRDKRWDRVEKAYDALTLETADIEDKDEDNDIVFAKDWKNALQDSFDKGETDEFVKPIVLLDESGKRIAAIEDGDSVIFFNFRPDRARELTYAFTEPDEKIGFKRKVFPKTYFVGMTQYDEELKIPTAYPPKDLKNTIGEYLAANNKKQLRIAETEKYAHVTFFFNGGVEEPNPNEERVLIPSPKVATYDLKPEMAAYEVTNALIQKIDEDKYDFIVLNFANMDMVGHTGDFNAAKAAVEAVDTCVGKIAEKIIEKDGALFITADHGNAEKMTEETGDPCTAHTTNPVRMIYVDDRNIDPNTKNPKKILRDGGRLCDIAPTLLEIMGMEIPKEMTGETLLVKNEK
ncbi:2,3-bisphosphoglycerate-independent phosphoglycerate mutase [Methanimicrococcus hongohii]|uniref:2,3-bisphosphoglycerate-independent phosphoglycerate mutase n=1 Tax=Methanimicrococcus hongohii TaxID=3028295 RepID=A0AA96V0F6_9EURY|nr:2,3-bisphosphoglycerate-independent phosphoglycerate mutase [Methanimicrococcus sp. Hf6]WNY24087.1 2,3-bisphosphoglycerate-independent phosphoglycerate mutase [Methanimicrococcus sp. Hf6]